MTVWQVVACTVILPGASLITGFWRPKQTHAVVSSANQAPPKENVMIRTSYQHGGLNLSYLDAGGAAPVLIAIHSHWMTGFTYAPLAAALAPHWRVVAPDQRGHGDSDHAPSYTRDDYLGDLGALYDHLGVDRAVLLGNSLGGVNAYQFAARRPERVRALVIEDIGAVVNDDQSFVLPWAGTFATREALIERVGPRMSPYLEEAVRQTPDGWRLAFEPSDMVASQAEVNGDHWADWLASTCPALLIHGEQSRVTTAAHLDEMAARRPHTVLCTLPGGLLHSPRESGP